MQTQIIIALIISVISFLSFRNYTIERYNDGKISKQKHYDHIVYATIILLIIFFVLFYLLIEVIPGK